MHKFVINYTFMFRRKINNFFAFAPVKYIILITLPHSIFFKKFIYFQGEPLEHYLQLREKI